MFKKKGIHLSDLNEIAEGHKKKYVITRRRKVAL